MFANDWTLTYNGKSLQITKEDLKNYHDNGLTDDEIKSMAFSYLSKQLFFDFEKPSISTYEF